MPVLSKLRIFKTPIAILTRDQLVMRLRLIAQLQDGQTINVTTHTIGDHSTWFSSWNRWFHSESRRLTLEYVLLTESQLPVYNDDPEVLELMDHVRQGLQHLVKTYENDDLMVRELTRVIEYVSSLIPAETPMELVNVPSESVDLGELD